MGFPCNDDILGSSSHIVTSAVCRGFQAGSFHVFGAGLAFPDQLMDTETLTKAKAQLSKRGQPTMKTLVFAKLVVLQP
jgi:hypothetical protein